MELRHLRYFSMLAEELHFHRAAKKLNISQPVLSIAIRQLEESLGFTLFERTSKVVGLTLAGKTFERSAKSLLRAAEDAVREAKQIANGATGTLRVGYDSAMLFQGLPQAFLRFKEAYPDVRLTLTELSSREQIAALSADHLDMGFVNGQRIPVELERQVIATEPFLACLPSDHHLANRSKVKVSDFQDLGIIQISRAKAPESHARIHSIFTEAGVGTDFQLEAEHWLAVVSLVSQGIGVALVPRSVQRCDMPGAVFRVLENSKGTSEIFGVWRTSAANPFVRRLFEETVRESRSAQTT